MIGGVIVRGVKQHRLTQVDLESMSAICAVCGPVRIRMKKDSHSARHIPQCLEKRRQERRAAGVRWASKNRNRAQRERREALGTVCGICGETCSTGNALAVDHDHGCCPTGPGCETCIRGVLCARCNMGLGMFRDRLDLLKAAIEYLS